MTDAPKHLIVRWDDNGDGQIVHGLDADPVSIEARYRRVDMPVRVKPLVWVEAADSWQSDVYSITTSYGQGPERFLLSRGTKIIRWDDAAAPLKAVAQADHDARIRSALEE